MSRVWKLDGSVRQVTPGAASRWSARVSPIRMCWSHPTKKHIAESGRETRCMCSRFNPHIKSRANKDKKQSRNFDFSDPSETSAWRRKNDKMPMNLSSSLVSVKFKTLLQHTFSHLRHCLFYIPRRTLYNRTPTIKLSMSCQLVRNERKELWKFCQ